MHSVAGAVYGGQGIAQPNESTMYLRGTNSPVRPLESQLAGAFDSPAMASRASRAGMASPRSQVGHHHHQPQYDNSYSQARSSVPSASSPYPGAHSRMDPSAASIASSDGSAPRLQDAGSYLSSNVNFFSGATKAASAIRDYALDSTSLEQRKHLVDHPVPPPQVATDSTIIASPSASRGLYHHPSAAQDIAAHQEDRSKIESAVFEPGPEDVVGSAVALSQSLPIDYRVDHVVKPKRRQHRNDARIKWGKVVFEDKDAVKFREELIKKLIEQRMEARKRNTVVTFPDRVSDEALQYGVPRLGTEWESFSAAKHIDYDALLRLETEKKRLREQEVEEQALQHQREKDGGKASEDLWVFKDQAPDTDSEDEDSPHRRNPILSRSRHKRKGLTLQSEDAEDIDPEGLVDFDEAGNRWNGRRVQYQALIPPTRNRFNTPRTMIAPPEHHVIDRRKTVENLSKEEAYAEQQDAAARTSNAPYTLRRPLTVIEKDLRAASIKQRQERKLAPRGNNMAALLPFFSTGMTDLDPVPVSQVNPQTTEVRQIGELQVTK